VNWTREKPTQPGWYWMIDNFDDGLDMAHVEQFGNKLFVKWMGLETHPELNVVSGVKWWMGPIEVPALPDGVKP
jgi:hypothetical protein